jgi:lipopolysaccharide export system permease protein
MREIELKHITSNPKTTYTNIVHSGINGDQYLIETLDLDNKTMYNVTINRLQNGSVLVHTLIAKKMAWTDEAKWIMTNCIERKYSYDTTEPVMEKKYVTHVFETADRPQDFVPQTTFLEELTLAGLAKEIDRLRKHSLPHVKESVHMQFRISYPFSCFVITFFAIPFAIRLDRKYAKVRGVGYILMIAFGYWVFTSLGKTFGDSGRLAPVMSAWFANIVFLAVGSVFYFRIKR